MMVVCLVLGLLEELKQSNPLKVIGICSGLITSAFSRAFPGSEFVVANTLAKWKKFEPNEINFSQGFSQKVVSTSCFVFNSLPARGNFCCLLITFANSLDPDQA